MRLPDALLLLGLLLVFSPAAHAQASDSDHDGLPDALEQALASQFLPTFMVSRQDCSTLPARFDPTSSSPRPLAEDGTIYAQLTPIPHSAIPSAVEAHFFHLWRRDCGSLGHPLDAEHVSALLAPDSPLPSLSADIPATHWHAVYWYAAAHEDTVCDASQITRASTLQAQQHGPTVWISSGKHASFLAEQLCGHGCGGDRCDSMQPLVVPSVINLGEAAHPAAGTPWAASPAWPLAPKISRSDLRAPVLARLDLLPASDIAWVTPGKHPAQGTIAVANTAAGAIVRSDENTGAALARANAGTDSALIIATGQTAAALGKSYRGVTHSLSKSAGKVGRVLRVTPTPTRTEAPR